MPKVSLKHSRLPFEVTKGITVNHTLYYYQDENLTTPVDLTGYSARMKIKDKDGELLFYLTTEDVTPNPNITIDRSNGGITLYISDSDTESVVGNKFVYDLELISGSGQVLPFVAGPFIFIEEVTD